MLRETLFNIVATASLITVARPLWALRKQTASTTVVSAADWAIAAWAAWIMAAATDWLPSAANTRWSDHLWYTAAVLTLTPFTAVLGARRPGTRVWTAFVILPLILVLEWPAVSSWAGSWPPRNLELEAPALAAVGLVLIMGTGNYLGTRYAWPVLGITCAVPLLLMPLTGHAFSPAWPPGAWRAAACLSLALCVLWIGRKAPRRPPPTDLDRLWIDFRDLFGVAWAHRVQAQINATAAQEHWPVRLELHGRVQPEGISADQALSEATRVQIERALRWSLRRFVDADWIDIRLRTRQSTVTDGGIRPPAAG